MGALERGDRVARTLNIKVADFRWQYHKFKVKSQSEKKKGQLRQQNPRLALLRKEFEKDVVGNRGIIQGHLGKAGAPSGKVDMGALGALMAIIQGEMKEAIDAEMAELGYE
jgi:hypothetical protein